MVVINRMVLTEMGLIEGLIEIFTLGIPILIILSIFGFLIVMVYLDHKKDMAMIEKGLIFENKKNSPENLIGWGIAILGIGMSLIISWTFNLNDNVMMGFVLISIGVALLISYLIKIKIQIDH